MPPLQLLKILVIYGELKLTVLWCVDFSVVRLTVLWCVDFSVVRLTVI